GPEGPGGPARQGPRRGARQARQGGRGGLRRGRSDRAVPGRGEGGVDRVELYCATRRDEASTWVRRHDGGSNRLLFRLLPLHAASVFDAPPRPSPPSSPRTPAPQPAGTSRDVSPSTSP
ncbi:hypothetical protein THAOC_07836, partial [Thalassiosira oceanica]